ncbi:MAG: hypothetical protein HZA54_02085 [Planctomycetes bacterium]|nr:hypothetical protein [Planctomycetota bacterium]
MLEEKGGRGFPYLVMMDAEGAVLAAHAGPRTVEGFAETLRRVRQQLETRKKAESGDVGARIDLLIDEVEGGRMKPEAARAKLAELGKPTPEQEARLNAALATGEVMEVMQAAGPGMRTVEGQRAIAQKFYEMKKAGRVPTDERASFPFWNGVADAAQRAGDVEVYEECLKTFSAKLAGNPAAAPALARYAAVLADLRRVRELGKQGAAGDAGAAQDALILQVDLDQVKVAEAEAKLKGLGELSAERQARWRGVCADHEVQEIVTAGGQPQSQQEAQERQAQWAAKFLAMKQAGRIPVKDQAATAFWSLLADLAEKTKDVGLFEEAFGGLSGLMGKMPRGAEMRKQMQEKLEALKAAAAAAGGGGGAPAK